MWQREPWTLKSLQHHPVHFTSNYPYKVYRVASEMTLTSAPRQRRVEQHVCLPIISGLRWGPGQEFFAKRGMHGELGTEP